MRKNGNRALGIGGVAVLVLSIACSLGVAPARAQLGGDFAGFANTPWGVWALTNSGDIYTTDGPSRMWIFAGSIRPTAVGGDFTGIVSTPWGVWAFTNSGDVYTTDGAGRPWLQAGPIRQSPVPDGVKSLGGAKQQYR